MQFALYLSNLRNALLVQKFEVVESSVFAESGPQVLAFFFWQGLVELLKEFGLRVLELGVLGWDFILDLRKLVEVLFDGFLFLEDFPECCGKIVVEGF